MALSQLRGAIANTIQGVSRVGIVNDFEPYAKDRASLEKYFLDPGLGRIQGWTITRESALSREKDTESIWRDSLFVIRGYCALGGAGESEREWQDKVDEVLNRLSQEESSRFEPYDLNDPIDLVAPPSLRIAEPRMFSDVLCHYCEITLRVTEHLGG